MTKSELAALARKHFPFETPNPGQIEAVVDIASCFLSGTKHVVVQAPTGIGKSAIASTLHRVLKEIDSANRTTITTATKGLQDQYAMGDKMIFDLKGKTNYKCPYGKGPYNSGQCRAAQKQEVCMGKSKICPYVITRRHWCKVAELRTTNASFMVESCPIIYQGFEDTENWAKTMIIDECHEIDDQIIEHTKMRFETVGFADLEELGYTMLAPAIRRLIRTFSGNEVGTPFNLGEKQYEAMRELDGVVEEIHDELSDRMEAAVDDKAAEFYGDLLESIDQIRDKTKIFMHIGEGKYASTEWIVSEYESKMTLELKSVYAHQVAEYALFRKAERFLHMSATICGFQEYATTLGLEDYKSLELPNPIEKERREVIVLDRFRVNASFNEWDEFTEAVDSIIESHPEENGVIHTVSYKLAEQIYSRSKYQRKMLIGRDRREIMDWLKGGKGRIVLSPSVEKGYDFKGDLARWQIIAKVPYLYLGDPFVKMNTDLNPGWYARKAILRVVQACGRVTRGMDDYGTTFVLDSNFSRLLGQNKKMFPRWFQEAIVTV